jgi:hypothetical protein
MASRKQSKGECVFCQKPMTRGGLSKHFKSCVARKKALATADDAAKGKRQGIYHVLVADAYSSAYWLHLEINGETSLSELDWYLRQIWLECCGHLSAFRFKGGWMEEELDMQQKIATIAEAGVELEYMYDFGSTSELVIKVIEERQGKPLSKHPIFLMARNLAPEYQCMACDKPATHFCQECVYEHEKSGLLCDEHLQNHPHDDYGEPLPIVNSPRVGMCDYDGPAEPPY